MPSLGVDIAMLTGHLIHTVRERGGEIVKTAIHLAQFSNGQLIAIIKLISHQSTYQVASPYCSSTHFLIGDFIGRKFYSIGSCLLFCHYVYGLQIAKHLSRTNEKAIAKWLCTNRESKMLFCLVLHYWLKSLLADCDCYIFKNFNTISVRASGDAFARTHL